MKTTMSNPHHPGPHLLRLSRNDPLDAFYYYFSSDGRDSGRPLYVVSTRSVTSLGPSSSRTGGAGARITTIDRVLPPPTRPPLSVLHHGHQRTRSRHGPSPLSASTSASVPATKSHWSSSSASSSAAGSSGDKDGLEEGCRVRVATITRPLVAFSLFTPVTVALAGNANGSSDTAPPAPQPAKSYLRKAGLLSSTRVFRSTSIGQDLRWSLSTPTPKLYDPANKRLAAYRRPFLPDASDIFSSAASITSTKTPTSNVNSKGTTPVLELDADIRVGGEAESDDDVDDAAVHVGEDSGRKGKTATATTTAGSKDAGMALLDEIIVSLVLTFCL